jgi:hypothetical protein
VVQYNRLGLGTWLVIAALAGAMVWAILKSKRPVPEAAKA